MSILLGEIITALFLVLVSAIYATSEYLRVRGYRVPIFTSITDRAMRNTGEEQKGFVMAPLYLAIGVTAPLLIFPHPLNYAAIAVVTLGDGFASVIGRLYGRHVIPNSDGKTFEGTAAGMVCAFVGASFFVSPALALIAAAVGMTAEFLRLRINDNISVPLLSGISITIADLAL